MNYKTIIGFFSSILIGGICLAQINQTAAVEDFKTSSTTQSGKQYPQVNSEGRVRASIMAPQAQKVQLDIGGKRYDLTKDDKGVWTGVSDPQDEGFHYYQLNIDGAQVPDPGSLSFYGASRWGSGIEVPAKDQDFYALKDVPHGQVRENLYFSNGKFKDGEALNKQIRLFWLGLGTKEPNPFPGSVGAFRAMLDKAGIKYVYYESQGTAHEWLTWRRDLYQFAPLLFR